MVNGVRNVIGKIRLVETEDGVAAIFPDSLLEKLGVKIGDWVKLDPTEMGYLISKDDQEPQETD